MIHPIPGMKLLRAAALLPCLWMAGLHDGRAAPAQASEPFWLQQVDAIVRDDPVAGMQAAEAALRAAEQARATRKALEAAVLLATTASQLERTEVAARGLAEAQRLAAELGDETSSCYLAHVQAAALSGDDKLDEARSVVDARIALGERNEEPWCTARLYQARAGIASQQGRTGDAVADLDRAHEQFQALDDRAGMASVLSDFSWLYHKQSEDPERLQRALEAGEQALALVQPASQRYLAATIHHNVAGVLLAAKRMPEASAHVAEAFKFAQAIHDDVGGAYISRLSGRIELAAGRPAQALVWFGRAKDVFAVDGPKDMWLEASARVANALVSLGRYAEADKELAAAEPTRLAVNSSEYDAFIYQAQLDSAEAQKKYEAALRASKALLAVQRRIAEADNKQITADLEARFQLRARDEENRHLREQQSTQSEQRWLLLASLVLSLMLVAAMGWHLLHQRRTRQLLAELAAKDELTGLVNRRAIMARAQSLRAQAGEFDGGLSIAILDIDHFKHINDRYGHHVGDAVLVGFAKACLSSLRKQDHIGRIGGEEFLLVMPGVRRPDVQIVFDRVREAVAALSVPPLPAERQITFSMGCATLMAHESLEQALQRADEALYRAKNEGRDRFMFSSPAADA